MQGPRKNHVGKRLGAKWDALGQGAPAQLAGDLMETADFAYAAAVRPKRAPAKRTDPERTLVQRPLVNYLRKHLPPGSVVFAITNHARSKQQVFALIRDGMKPGMPDVCCLVPPRFGIEVGLFETYFIECKRPDGGALSESQQHAQEELKALGIPVLPECRSVEQAVEWLRSQGVSVS